jgi:hypothetical protein
MQVMIIPGLTLQVLSLGFFSLIILSVSRPIILLNRWVVGAWIIDHDSRTAFEVDES